ncbi:MAG: META domain-containing protein [Steroidobacteraceae bacterium]
MQNWTTRRHLPGATAALMAALTAASAAATPTSLDGTAWVLAKLGDAPAPDVPAVTLAFQGGRVSGTDGCNRYTGTYRSEGAGLALGADLASTKMACPDPVMATADAWNKALTTATGWRIVDGRLELLGSGGKRLATLAAQTSNLAGTHWKATGINNGRQAVVSVLPGTTVTIAFDANGGVAGSAGCNRYTAPYRAAGASIEFGKAAATMMACGDTAVMEQEQDFFRALETAQVVRIEGERMELRTATGALAAGFVRTTGD